MKPQIEFNNVVFPAPFSPISATISPGIIFMEKSSNAILFLYFFVKLSIESASFIMTTVFLCFDGITISCFFKIHLI